MLPSAYSQGHFGKWHVGGQCDGDPYDSILELGWDYHDGSWEDIKDEAPNNDYCNWPNHVINGVLQVDAMGDEVPETTYATDYVVQEASGWIDTLAPSLS